MKEENEKQKSVFDTNRLSEMRNGLCKEIILSIDMSGAVSLEVKGNNHYTGITMFEEGYESNYHQIRVSKFIVQFSALYRNQSS